MRENFLKNEVDAGESVVAVYCGERDPVGFWLARVEAESNKSNAALHPATKADPNWDIRKGDKILNVTWLNRVSGEQPRKFKLQMPQKISMNSILPVKAVWEQNHGLTYTLSRHSHDLMCEWRDCVRDDLHKERTKLLAEVTKPAVMGDKRAAFEDLPPTMRKLLTMKCALSAKATAFTAAFAAQAAHRRAQVAMLHSGAMDEDDAPLTIMKVKKRQQSPSKGRGTKRK